MRIARAWRITIETPDDKQPCVVCSAPSSVLTVGETPDGLRKAGPCYCAAHVPVKAEA